MEDNEKLIEIRAIIRDLHYTYDGGGSRHPEDATIEAMKRFETLLDIPFDSENTPSKEMTQMPASNGPLAEIKAAIADYHKDVYAKEIHPLSGMYLVIEAIEKALGIPYEQGAELERRQALASTGRSASEIVERGTGQGNFGAGKF